MYYYQDPLIFIIWIGLSIGVLVIGLITMRKKTIVIKGYIHFFLFITVVTILVLIFLYRCFINYSIFDGFDYFSYLYVIFIVSILFFVPLIDFKNYFHALEVYNVKYGTLHESFTELLNQNKISYEEKNGDFVLPSLKAIINVKIKPFNRTIIHYKVKDKKVRTRLISDLIKILSEKKIDSFPTYGLITIITAVLGLFLLVIIWIFIRIG